MEPSQIDAVIVEGFLRVGKRVQAVGISALLLAVLLWYADPGAIDFSRFRPSYIFLCVGAYLVMLSMRAMSYYTFSSAHGDEGGGGDWARLAARHQLVFLAGPSGTGDLVFPVLANKVVGIDPARATGIIILSRARDLCAVVGLGIVGLVGAGLGSPALLVLAAAAFYALVWIEQIFGAVLWVSKRCLSQGSKAGNRMARLAEVADQASGQSLRRSGLTVGLWLCASAAVWSGFFASGYPMSVFECWIMIAGLNIAGALAVSIAGLGVAEAGAAGVLIFFGEAAPDAAAIAIIARPALLFCLVAASAVMESCTWLFFRQ